MMWLIELRSCDWACAKAALTLAFWPLERTTWQVAPLQAPLKPEKLNPAAGAALRLTAVPGGKLAAQLEGQLIPAGVLVTVPLPESATVNWAAGTAVNVAETVWLLESTILQDEPVHAPAKPAKLKPDAGAGVMVTVVPGAKLAVQVDGQLIPDGLLVIVPVPDTATVSCTGVEVDGPEPPPQATNSNARHKENSNKGRRDTG
jgi:hypothetical protein